MTDRLRRPEGGIGTVDARQRPDPGFRTELAERTRASGVLGALLALASYLSWAGLDRILAPEHAAQFLRIRLGVCAGIALAMLLLVSGRVRGRGAGLTTFAMAAAVQAGIAWMLPRVGHELPAYLLGFTLAIWASALLIDWHWAYPLALSGFSWVALAAANLLATQPMSVHDQAVTGFYVASASLISLAGHALRYRTARAEFHARTQAEWERERNSALVQQLDALSRCDPLTGLANRRVFDAALVEAIATAERDSRTVAVAMLDIDHFKVVNDRWGHQAGDDVLTVVASTLAARVRGVDLVARFGGEEFVVIMPGVGVNDAEAVLDGIRREISAATCGGEACPIITVSAGVAVYPHHGLHAQDVLRVADIALYRAKAAGRDRTQLGGRDDRIGRSRPAPHCPISPV